MDFEKIIECSAFSNDAITNGHFYYERGFVHDLEVTETASQQNVKLNFIASASVQGSSGNFYEASVIVHDSVLAVSHCQCPAFEIRGGLCKHLVALLLAVKTRHFQEELTPQLKKNRQNNSINHYWTEHLLKQYQPNFSPLSGGYNDKVHLWPQLFFRRGEEKFALTFTLGINRPYVLKSLHQFTERMKNGEVFRYGKDLEFAHIRENFAEDSLYYLDLILETAANVDTLVELSHYYVPKGQVFGRELYLGPQAFDRFFDYHLKNTGLTIVSNHTAKNQGQLIEGDPAVMIAVDAIKENQFQMVIDLDNYLLYESQQYAYLAHHNKIYRLSSGFRQYIFPILASFQRSVSEQMIFTTKQLSAFLGLVYQPASQLARFDISPELIQRLQPAELNAQLYFDYPKTNTIRAKVEFHYDNLCINPLGEPLEETPFRERHKEYAILNLLQQFHFTVKDEYYFLYGEDAIYDFLTQGLNQLLPLGQIMVEDKLEKMKSKKTFHLSMDITMTKGIIEIKFDDTKFTTEELTAVIKAYQEGKKYILLKDDTFLDIINPSAKLLNQMVTDFDLSAKALSKQSVKLPAYRALYLNSLLEETPEVNAKRSRPYKDMVRDILEPIDTDFAVPENLQAQLRQYQLIGYRWLKTLAYYGFGGILADDMGLGKTIQVITFLLSEMPNATRPSIIVVPTSLIYNWQREIAQFAPDLSYRIITGNAENRRKLLQDIAPTDILITSYDTLKRDVDQYSELEFEYCIADEAQYIKNHYTQNAQAIKSLASRVRFALTGTPMENSLADLWSIMDFIMPGYLLKWQKFKSIYEIPITRYNDSERLYHLKQQVAPFLLRRLKKDVLTELPDKIESVIYAQFDTEEEKIYHAQLALSHKAFLAEIANNGIERSQIKILALLTRLRQACCSPRLFLDNYTKPSSKLLLLMDIIREKQETGSQILVFSQFTTMLDLIAEELDKNAIPYLLLTGATKSAQRMHLVNQFNNEQIPVFLISLKAGGVGLNLTAADTVIHFDPWWNLSAQNQATDRAHRIGQDKKVHVIKLITKDTIEEKIEILQNKKRDLTDQIITQEQTFLTHLGQEELENLFSLQDYAD